MIERRLIPIEAGKPQELAELDQIIADCLSIRADMTAREIAQMAAQAGYTLSTSVVWQRLGQIYGTSHGGWVAGVRKVIQSMAGDMCEALHLGMTDEATAPKDRAQIALKALAGMGVLNERREFTGRDGAPIEFKTTDEAREFIRRAIEVTVDEDGASDNPGCVPVAGDA